tara:strand:- start:217 stop:936 length:720 start_codon:yes stop_codon:yes gene_type:complete
MLSHSLGSSCIMWDNEFAALQERYRVLRYDTRGHGGTAAPDGPYDLDLLGDDAMALMDALGLGPLHWVGLSMGGMIGQNIALRQPQRLQSLSLCDTSARVPAEARPIWDDRIAAARDEGMTALVEPTMQRWFTPGYLRSDPPAVAPIRAQFLATPAAGFIGCCQALKQLDYLDRLPAVKLPTVIIVGEEDMGTPVAASEAMHARIAGSELVVIPSAAHLANVEQPDAFEQALFGFLDRQ